MESLVLIGLLILVVGGVAAAKRHGLLSGSVEDHRIADRAEDAARAAPHYPGDFSG